MEAALRTVETHYAALFEDAPSLTVGGNLVFTGTEDDPDTMETLRRLGFQNPSAVAAMVRGWHHGRYRATRSDRARQLLTEIMPALLMAFGKTAQSDAALVRFDQSLAQLSSGVQLLATFQANPALLDLVAEIMGDAPRLAELVAQNPALLDYVLEPEFFEPIPDADGLHADLDAVLSHVSTFEEVLDISRRWANDLRFRIGVQLLRGQVAAETAAVHFSDTAEAALRGLTPWVERDFARQYGRVPGGAVAIVAYGKLGSRELTPTSDLDLVLIYDHAPEAVSIDGPKSLSAPGYYARFVQRLVSAVTLMTREGMLYNVDLRLRPDGDKGPLAASLAAFAKYHGESSWTWEHMALTRARVVYGPDALAARIKTVIDDTLARPRDPGTLRREVADMRARMRKEHPGLDPWDIKHRPGGMVDAEFLVEYQVLLGGGLIRPAGRGMAATVRDLVASGALSTANGEILTRGLLLWQRLQVMLRLTLADEHSPDIPLGLQGKLATVFGVTEFETLHTLITESATAISQLLQNTLGDRRD
jgi:glutamate-ammonia-ligase adenylyltransferase